jgi:hypothetical protein
MAYNLLLEYDCYTLFYQRLAFLEPISPILIECIAREIPNAFKPTY